MKPPRCRVCQSEHWLHEDHVFKGDVPKPSELCTPRMANSMANKIGEVAGSSPAPRREVRVAQLDRAPRSYKYRDHEARKKYQRELMRKRRALPKKV